MLKTSPTLADTSHEGANMTEHICAVIDSDGTVCGRPCGAYSTMCGMHKARTRRHGDPLGGRRRTTPNGEPQQFFNELVLTPSDECRPWPYSRDKDGYGLIHFEGKFQRLPGLVCTYWYGPRPDGMWACHLCRGASSGCWVGNHMMWGTPELNGGAHRRRDGTVLLGTNNPSAKLSQRDIDSIRARYIPRVVTQAMLAAEFNVHEETIGRLLRGQHY